MTKINYSSPNYKIGYNNGRKYERKQALKTMNSFEQLLDVGLKINKDNIKKVINKSFMNGINVGLFIGGGITGLILTLVYILIL